VPELHALIVAPASARVLGLSLAERARRVAARVGASRVVTLDSPSALSAWAAARGDADVLVLRGDQVVHPPLAQPLVEASGARRISVDLGGLYAGALLASGAAAVDELIAALTSDLVGGDRVLEARWLAAGGAAVPHGDIAHHRAETPTERRGAARMLLRILVKSEDSPVSKYIYRPVSRPMTLALVGTPITPNQISILVGIIGAIGCWVTSRAGQSSLIWGAALVLFAGFLDGCDGEIARLRLTSSKLGAWLDTIVDEATTTAYLVATGLHLHAERPTWSWVVPSIVVGFACYCALIFALYFYLIVVSKTGNSQHYEGSLDLVETPSGPALRVRRRAASQLPRWLRAIAQACLYLIRRDAINLGALALACLNLYIPLYLLMFLGGLVAALIAVPQHLILRSQLRALRSRGALPRLIP
jgi:phosphatidylglycerophosphate synthase